MKKITWTQYVFLLSLVFYSFSVLAIECNDASPNLKKQGDKYFDINEAPKLTKQQINTLKKLVSSVKKRVEGSSVITVCKGPVNQLTKEIIREKLSAKINLNSDGELTIDIEAYDLRKKITYPDSLDYFGKNSQYMIDELVESGFVVSRKIRKKTGRPGFTTFVEDLTRLNVVNGKLTIRTFRYINGYFAEEHKREFR